MHYIIFASTEPMKLGRQTLKLADGNADIHLMPCVIVREATREEWIADHPEIVEPELRLQLGEATHFYALSVD